MCVLIWSPYLPFYPPLPHAEDCVMIKYSNLSHFPAHHHHPRYAVHPLLCLWSFAGVILRERKSGYAVWAFIWLCVTVWAVISCVGGHRRECVWIINMICVLNLVCMDSTRAHLVFGKETCMYMYMYVFLVCSVHVLIRHACAYHPLDLWQKNTCF